MQYLDHSASTPLRPEALAAMLPYLTEIAANPSGLHAASRQAKTALEAARERVGALMGCDAREVIFTGGGSESDNLAVKGAARSGLRRGLDRVVTSGIEHKAVLAAAHRMADDGIRISTVPATKSGAIDLDQLRESVDDRTAVVSVMLVNNETGTVQPLETVRAIVRDHAPRAVLHTDAVQAPQWLDVRTATACADLVSISGHKFGGPKGVGVLVRRNGVEIDALIEGGGHELGYRAGTQNVAGIVALAEALAVTDSTRTEECARIARLRDRLSDALFERLDGLSLNGDPTIRVPGLLHVAVEGVEAETLLVALDRGGVCAASGSACSSGAVDPSHVLLAMGVDRVKALSSVRFSLGWASTDEDIDAAIPVIVDAVRSLRGGKA